MSGAKMRQVIFLDGCENCGRVVTATRNDAKYCSDGCRKEAWRRQRRYESAVSNAIQMLNNWRFRAVSSGILSTEWEAYKNGLRRIASAIATLDEEVYGNEDKTTADLLKQATARARKADSPGGDFSPLTDQSLDDLHPEVL